MQAGKYSYVDNAKYISDAIPSLAAFLQNSINELVKYLLALNQVELDVLSTIDCHIIKTVYSNDDYNLQLYWK